MDLSYPDSKNQPANKDLGGPPPHPSAPDVGFPNQYPPQGAGGGYPPPPGYQPQWGPPGGSPGSYGPSPAAGYSQPPGTYYPPPAGAYPQPGYGAPQAGYGPPAGGYGQPQGGYMPVVNQPMAANNGWMTIPQGLPNCPPGLEYLTMIDQLLVHQKVELLEALTGFETKNKFTVKNSLGQKVYYAVEDTDCLTRNCCGPLRPFEMNILDNYQNQIIRMNRPFACDSCCFPCCLQSMEVFSPPNVLVGKVEQEWSIFRPKFVIKDAADNPILKIRGPICTLGFCSDIEFKVLSLDKETEVGRISKQWSGLVREMFTDTDYFGITFPMDLDVKMKAVMLGACFLIDAMFFEKSGNNNSV